jgi:hypothetical protein
MEWTFQTKPPFNIPLNRSHWASQGLVACYAMNEGCGDLVHDSCGMNDGKFIGAAPMSGTSGWITGPHGAALAFPGASGYVNVGVSYLFPSLKFNGKDFSVGFWLNWQVNTGTPQRIIGAKRDTLNNNAGWSFALYTAGQVTIAFSNGTASNMYSSAYVPPINAWVHLMFTIKQTGVFGFYVNGASYYGTTFSPFYFADGPAGDSEYGLMIGKEGYTGSRRWLNGLISSVSIYNRALSAEEIAYLYAFPWCMYDRGARAFYSLPLPALIPQHYEPYIAADGIPAISQETQQIHWGASQISSGSVKMENGRGFFDQIAKRWIWNNKDIKLLLGGDSLAYAEYTSLFAGKIMQATFTKNNFTLDIESKAFALLRLLPINNFWVSTWAELDPAAEGKPIPYYWGSYSAAQAPLVTCIDQNYDANSSQWKICDCTYHAIKSITQVYIDYGAGGGWETIAHANEDLANATFTIETKPVLGTTRVKVAFEGYHSGGTLIDGAPEIVEDILLNQCGYAAADLNSTSFTNSKAASVYSLNVAIESEESALDVIEKICQSDLAFFDEDGAGLLRYRTWEPAVTGTLPVLAKEDILDPPEIVEDTSQLYWKIRAGYSWLGETGDRLYTEASNTASKYKYNRSEHLTIDTYLRTKADADILAQRLNWITRAPSPIISLKLKAGIIDKTLGAKIKVTLARAPVETAGGFDERTFEIISKEVSCFPLFTNIKGRDLMGYGNDVGFWMGDTAPAWAAATAQEKEDSGFWCDDDGYCLTADSASINKSLWW